MNDFLLGYSERVRYTMQNKTFGKITLETDPIGWKSDNKEYARNEDYDGIVAKFSNNLTFVGDGAEFINNVYDLEDIIGEIRLEREEMHPTTNIWTRIYWGYLDLETREIEDGEVKIKFNAGSLEQALKSRENEAVEIDRISTIDGVPIPELETKTMALDGRRIFLKSKWETKEYEEPNPVLMSVFSDDGNTRSRTEGFPLENLVSKSHEQAQAVIFGSTSTEGSGTTGMMILADFDRDRTLRIKGQDLHFRPIITRNDYQWAFLKVCLTVYSGGTDYNVKERRNLFFAHSDGDEMVNLHDFERISYNPITEITTIYNEGQSYTINFDEIVNVSQGDSVAVEFFMKADLEDALTGGARFSLTIFDCSGTVYVDEDSFFEPSKSKFIFVHEMLDRLATICTNKFNIFRSSYFGRIDLGYSENGFGGFNGVNHGFWIREFDKIADNPEENRFKPLTISFKDAVESLNAIHNVSLGIENINNKETIILEDTKYFYQPLVTIKLPNQVKKVKRKVASKKYFNSIEIGYENGGTYEEAQGLDEPNATSKFTTIINKGKNVYSKLSKLRTDGYGKEFTRRKPFKDYSTTDTSFDSDIWINDLKSGPSDIFVERKWADDFETIPTGIFSPETATNLIFSPLNMILRHGWWIASCLLKYPDEFVRYASSTANSNLKTKLIGGNEYAENGNILNSELGKAYFFPEEITFEHNVDFFIMEKVEGFTNHNGKRIPNFYGMVEFTNEFNQIERGWLLNLKPNGNGEWKIIKSNL